MECFTEEQRGLVVNSSSSGSKPVAAEMPWLAECAVEPQAQSSSHEYIVNPENTYTYAGDVMNEMYLSSWNNSIGSSKSSKSYRSGELPLRTPIINTF